MTGIVVTSNRLSTPTVGDRTADKAGLETIGLLLVLVTLLVICAGAFVLRCQHAADPPPDETTYGVHQREHIGSAQNLHTGLTAGSGRALIPSIMPRNFLV